MEQKLSRKEREYLQHRNEILQSAEKLFAEVGYHNTSMDMIAEKAEFSKGSLYNYFQNKENLFFSLLQEKLDSFTSKLNQKIEEQVSVEDKLSAHIAFYFDYFNQNSEFFKIAHTEKHRLDMNSREKLMLGVKEKYFSYTSMIIKIIRQTGCDTEKAELLAESINGILNSLMTRKILTGNKFTISKLKNFALENTLKLLR